MVTGATGQDGGYLVERLLDEGLTVHAVTHAEDSGSDEFRQRFPSVELHPGDLGTGAGLAEALADAAPDEVYNLAGISSVAFSWEQPLLTAEVSGVGVLRLLDALARWADDSGRQPRFVQASSAEMFGAPDQVPQNEATPVRPVTPYGAAKAFGHHAVAVYRQSGMHASSAILYNHESPRRPPTFVTRKITQAVAAIARGSDEPLVLGNLDARRDWGWAPDYVDAMVRIARAETPDDYVVATGESRTVAEFVEAAFAHVGIRDWQSYVRTDPSLVRPSDPPELVGDSSRLRLLGWKPTVSFAELVSRMVDVDLATS
jgi:GDPmannose 4,6-dehydratase